jgi:hypothetical protein
MCECDFHRAGNCAMGCSQMSRLVKLREDWLPFLNVYRTMCVAPTPSFRRLLDEIGEMRLAA